MHATTGATGISNGGVAGANGLPADEASQDTYYIGTPRSRHV